MVRISLDRDKIAEFCRRNHIRRLAFFGSVLRDDFRPESDIDVLVEYESGTTRRFQDLLRMAEELKIILGREVDLVERQAVERSENYIRRKHILKTAEEFYVA